MRTFLVLIEVEQIKKYSKINNVFHLVKPQDLRVGLYSTSYRRAWTMLLFRNSSTVSLFLLCRLRTAQPSRLHKRSRVRSTQFSTCCCAVWKWSVFLQVYSLMPDDRPERKRKGGSKNSNAIWKICYWLKILQVSKMKTKNRFQGYCQCSLWVSHFCDIWWHWPENTSQLIPFCLTTTSIITEIRSPKNFDLLLHRPQCWLLLRLEPKILTPAPAPT